MRHIRFIRAELINFTNHRNIVVEYGRITKLSGRNGQGKTSIGTAPVWTLYGTDLWGKTFNPSPTNYEFDRVFAALLLSVDGEQHKFAREIDEKGKNFYYIDDVPKTDTAFKTAVASLFDKDEFLSLYNPSYFFTQHKFDQRAQILKYVTAPASKEVYAEMSRTSPDQKIADITLNPQAAKLAELTKKHSLDDLKDTHHGTKNKSGLRAKLDDKHKKAQGYTKALQDQLQRMPPASDVDPEKAQLDIAKLDERITALQNSQGDEVGRKIEQLREKYYELLEKIKTERDLYNDAKTQLPDTSCSWCGQDLQADAKDKAVAAHGKHCDGIKVRLNGMIEQAKAAKEELANLRTSYQPPDDTTSTLSDLMDERQAIRDTVRQREERDSMLQQIAQAKADEEATLASLKESIFILDAIKAYRAKEAELQAEKVQALFTTLKIRLHKYVKTTDEYEPDFSIQMDGKDYVALSAGEKIAAGLELAEVLFQQSDLIVPCFIDGIESYTGKVAVYDQLITGRAVLDQDLKIEAEDYEQ